MDSHLSKILLDRYRDGDSSAAFEIYARYAQRLVALTRTRIGKRLASKFDPEDVTQTAFQAFFSKADRDEVFWQKQGDLWRLLAAICINHLKREVEFFGTAKRNPNVEQTIEAELKGELEHAENKLAELLESLLHDEKPLVSQVAQARLAGFSLAEIATQTNRSRRTVRRVLQILKAKLANDSTLNLKFHLDDGDVSPKFETDTVLFDSNYEDFDLLRMIDAGAFGKVYLARDRKTNSLVAVKALRKVWLGDETAESLFLNEARLLATLDHPNIIRFLDAGRLPNSSWFIVMEYAEGETFDRALESHPDLKTVLSWLHQASLGLDFLHRKNVTHGDLKPANILISDGNVRLIDFGFAKQNATANKSLRGGTEGFMPPERTSSRAGDVFAFGKVIEFAILNAPSIAEARCATWLGELVAMMTHKDREKRATAAEIEQMIVDRKEFRVQS